MSKISILLSELVDCIHYAEEGLKPNQGEAHPDPKRMEETLTELKEGWKLFFEREVEELKAELTAHREEDETQRWIMEHYDL